MSGFQVNPRLLNLKAFHPGDSPALPPSVVLSRMAANEFPFPPFNSVIDLLASNIALANRYPDYEANDLRSVLSRKFNVPCEGITISNGSSEIIIALCLAFLSREDEVIAPSLTFPLYSYAVSLAGARYTSIVMDVYSNDCSELLNGITPSTRLIFLCNPNNPTGIAYSPQSIRALIEKVPSHILLILDEAYIDFVDDSSDPHSFELTYNHQNLLILRTFSKLFGLAGLRVGYCMGAPVLLHQLCKFFSPYHVNFLSQLAAEKSLEDPAEIERRISWTTQQRVFISESLHRLSIPFLNSSTNFVFAHLGMLDPNISTFLTQAGIWVQKSTLEGWFRISLASEEENKRLIQVLERVGQEQ